MADEVKANGELVSLYAQRNAAIRSGGDVKGLNAEINAFVKNNNISTEVRRASSVAASNVQSNNRGADVKEKKKKNKKVPVIAISVGMAEMAGDKKKTKMMYGGMANGKKHNYAAGGSVSDNAGLRALKAASPEAYKKITGK
jgi:hypothetical protein